MKDKTKKFLENHLVLYWVVMTLGTIFYKWFVTDAAHIKREFKRHNNRQLCLASPRKYNDKIQWLKLYWRDSLAEMCADKFQVRQFVAERIGERYLNRIHGVYDSVQEIPIDRLPERFVLKATHGSGMNIFCANKEKIDWSHELRKMDLWLNTNFYWAKREWVYKRIQPRVVCEQIIDPKYGELRDYRFFCFNGEPKFVAVDLSITDKSRTRRNLYDLDWNLMDAEISYPKDPDANIQKPVDLSEMIKLSRELSRGFPHARVDFFYEDRIVFGEITFFHQSGMGRITPEDFELTMGDWISLPERSNLLV